MFGIVPDQTSWLCVAHVTTRFTAKTLTKRVKPPDHQIRTAADRHALEQGYYWDAEAGEHVCQWLEKHCTIRTGPKAGKPFVPTRFQRDEILLPTYCWKRPNGLRRFTRVCLTTGKKSGGKSCITANLSLYHALGDGEPSPLCVLAACTREQAAELYKEAEYSVRHNRHGMDKRLKITASHYKINDRKDPSSQIRTLSKDAPSKGGWSISYAAVDELALMPNSLLWDQIKGAGKARSQPLFFLMSNAGWDKNHFYYTQIYTPAKAILDGKSLDLHTLPVIYELPEVADWRDQSLWHLANPHLAEGLIGVDAFASEYQDALNSKAGEIWFRRFAANQFVPTELSGIVDMDAWNDCKHGRRRHVYNHVPVT